MKRRSQPHWHTPHAHSTGCLSSRSFCHSVRTYIWKQMIVAMRLKIGRASKQNKRTEREKERLINVYGKIYRWEMLRMKIESGNASPIKLKGLAFHMSFGVNAVHAHPGFHLFYSLIVYEYRPNTFSPFSKDMILSRPSERFFLGIPLRPCLP